LHATDQGGVVKYNYGKRFGKAGWQYTPYEISRYGNLALSAWCEYGDQDALEVAYAQAEFLINSAVRFENFWTWEYGFPNTAFDAPPGWRSGLSNSLAVDLLLHLYALSMDERYLEGAKMGAESFLVDVEYGGVAHTMPDNRSIFFEEVAHPEAIRSQILNGHLISLMHTANYLNNYERIIGKDEHFRRVQDQFEKGIEAVLIYKDEFDAGDRTYYCLGLMNTKPPTHYAHRIHIKGLCWLAEVTGDDRFSTTAKRWQQMLNTFQSQSEPDSQF